jgi:hypothetical protein
MPRYYVLTILITLHVILSILSTRMIIKSYLLDNDKKKINIILTWTIPILWFLIIKTITKGSSGTITKKERKIDKSNFYESGLGKHA